MKIQRTRITKTTLENGTKAEELRLRGFKTYYKAVVIKTVWYWRKDG